MSKKNDFNEHQQQIVEVQQEQTENKIVSVQNETKQENVDNKLLLQYIQNQLLQQKEHTTNLIRKKQTKNTYFADLIKKTFQNDKYRQETQIFIQEYEEKAIKQLQQEPNEMRDEQKHLGQFFEKLENDKFLDLRIQNIQAVNAKKHQKIFKLKIQQSQSKLKKTVQINKNYSQVRIKQYKQDQRDRIRDIIEQLNKQKEAKNQFYQELINKAKKPKSVQQQEKIKQQTQKEFFQNLSKSQKPKKFKFQYKITNQSINQKKRGKQAYKEQKSQLPKFVEMQIDFEKKQKQEIIENSQNIKHQQHIDFEEINKFEKRYLQDTLNESQFKKTFIKECNEEYKFNKTEEDTKLQQIEVKNKQQLDVFKNKKDVIKNQIKKNLYGKIVCKVYKPEYTTKELQQFMEQQNKLNWKKKQDEELELQKKKNLKQIPNYIHSLEDARNQYYSQDFLKPKYSFRQQSELKENVSQEEFKQKLQMKKAELELSKELKRSYFFMYEANKSQFSCCKPQISPVRKDKIIDVLKRKKLNQIIVPKDNESLLKNIKEQDSKIKNLAKTFSVRQQRKKDHFSAYLGLAKQKLQLLKNILQINKKIYVNFYFMLFYNIQFYTVSAKNCYKWKNFQSGGSQKFI